MDYSCSFKFREESTVNAYLIRYWQLASNTFHPVKLTDKGLRFSFRTDEFPEQAASCIRKQKRAIICINDYESLQAFEEFKARINAAFEEILPKRSAFEKQA